MHVLWVYVGGGHSVSVHVFLHVCTHVTFDTSFKSPSTPQVVQVNHMFTQKIEELSDSANSAKDRLQLFIQWWVDYNSNYDKLCPWLKGAASRLEQLVARDESTLLLSRAAANCQGMLRCDHIVKLPTVGKYVLY